MSSSQKSLAKDKRRGDKQVNINRTPSPPDFMGPSPLDGTESAPASPSSSKDSYITAPQSPLIPELVQRGGRVRSSPAFGATPALAEQISEDLSDHESEANRQNRGSRTTTYNDLPQVLVGSSATALAQIRQRQEPIVDIRNPDEPRLRQRTRTQAIPSNCGSVFTRSASPSPNPFHPCNPLNSPNLHRQINRTAQSSQTISSGTHNSGRPVSTTNSSQARASQDAFGTESKPSGALNQPVAISKSAPDIISEGFQAVRCYECAKIHKKCEGPIPTCVRCTNRGKSPNECFRQPRGNGVKNPSDRDGRDPGPKDRKPGLRKRKRDDEDEEEWGKGRSRRLFMV